MMSSSRRYRIGAPFPIPPQPGDQFLDIRLQRAQAVPAAKRSPEVAAFVLAMRHSEELCARLPLAVGEGGRIVPALPDTEATAQRVLREIALWARLERACGGDVGLPSTKIYNHLAAYLERGCTSPAYPPAARCLAEMAALLQRGGDRIGTHLWLCAAICVCRGPHYTDKQVVPAMRHLGDALVASNQESLDRQLRKLQGGAAKSSNASSTMPLLTTRRLAFNCYQYALETSYNAIHEEQRGFLRMLLNLLGFRRTTASPLMAAAIHCAEAVQQLEPRSPPSLKAAADAKQYAAFAGGDLAGECAASATLYLDAAEEAQRQRYHVLAVLLSSVALSKCGALLVSPSGGAGPHLSHDTAQSVLSAFQKAEAEYLAVKRFLPAKWVEYAAGVMDMGSRALPLLQRFLAGDVGREAQMEAFVSNMSLVSNPPNLDARCSGCGEEAAGLRKCAHCRQVGYCSRECQVAHWAEHKRECRPQDG